MNWTEWIKSLGEFSDAATVILAILGLLGVVGAALKLVPPAYKSWRGYWGTYWIVGVSDWVSSDPFGENSDFHETRGQRFKWQCLRFAFWYKVEEKKERLLKIKMALAANK